jgi:hypothetical protein
LAIPQGEEKVLAFAYCFYAAGNGSSNDLHRRKCSSSFYLCPVLNLNKVNTIEIKTKTGIRQYNYLQKREKVVADFQSRINKDDPTRKN